MDKEVVVLMYHIFFIHSSVDGHLGCFHVLALVNSEQHPHFREMVFVLFGFFLGGIKLLSNGFQMGQGFIIM